MSEPLDNWARSRRASDVPFVEFPHVGEQVKKGNAVGVVESVKVLRMIFTPREQ
jgi:glycine cleavage system H lipoate-binding protein